VVRPLRPIPHRGSRRLPARRLAEVLQRRHGDRQAGRGEAVISRDEHLTWCKKRALEYCDRGKPLDALGSMISDLKKHPELAEHPGIMLGAMLMFGGHLTDPSEARRFIEGFN
jgi:hypothetical protein